METEIRGLYIIEPEVFGDSRGWFFESYSKNKLKEAGIDADFVQDNRSFSAAKGTLRGLHFQNKPHAQTKLVSCTKGSVLDVAVDLRPESPTYKRWVSVELSEENKKLFFIPRGFAHGFLTLADNCEFSYKVDNYYDKPSDRSIRFDDPEIGVAWGIESPVLSDKDRNASFLKDCDINF